MTPELCPAITKNTLLSRNFECHELLRGGRISNYYEILEINPGADARTIRSAYRTLMFKCRCHPDLGGEEARAREINEAYEVLSDPAKRAKYNKSLGAEFFTTACADDKVINRRRVPRVKVDFTVLCKTENTLFEPARILDLSSLGCRLRTKGPLQDRGRVTIDISGHSVSGVVRWRRMFHPSIFQRVYESGIQFDTEFEDIDKIKI